MNSPTDLVAAPAFREALKFWSKLGWINFGGPAGQIAIMHRELVEQRRWVDEASFLHGLNYCMLLPGPEAMQLATWLGWRLHGVRGGLAAGTLFVLPATLLLALLSWVYLRFGELPLVAAALYGIQAAVLAIVIHALLRIGSKVLRTPVSFALAGIALLAIGVLHWPFPAVVLGAGALGMLLWRIAPRYLASGELAHAVAIPHETSRSASLPKALMLATALLLAWWLPLLAARVWLGDDSTAWAMGLFFSKAALVTLGGAYAVLPYVAQQAVDVHAWLTPEQMLVGLGLAESTPGPLIIVLEFVGFVGAWQNPDLTSPLLSALVGAAVTAWATFLPSFLFVLPGAPWIDRLRAWPALNAAMTAITAVVVGAIANLSLWFGWSLVKEAAPVSVGFVAVVAAVALFGLVRWHWNVPWIVLGAAVAGVMASLAGMS
ncbi:MAG: chromate efflux transporter [Pseudomonadota bacterium]|nr:chromate efflux transporter [Pseudomonadota bacterium]